MSCRGRRRLLTVQLSTESLSTRHCLCDHKCITHVHLPMLETSRIEARIRKKLTTARSGLLCKCQLESHQHSAVHTRCLLRDKHGKYICKIYTLNMGRRAKWNRCLGPNSWNIENGHLFSIIELDFNVFFFCIFQPFPVDQNFGIFAHFGGFSTNS